MKPRRDEIGGNAISERLLAVLLNPWFLAGTAAILLFAVSLEMICPCDEAIWEYSAWLWAVHGEPPYVGSFENKPAGIFLLYRLSYAVFGASLWPVRTLGVAATVGTLLLLFSLGRRYYGRTAGAMAALIFGLAMAHRVTEGCRLAVTETFMIPFTTLAFYLLSRVYWSNSPQRSWRFSIGLGAAFGAALTFKQIALADLIGLVPMYWIATRPSRSPRTVLLDILSIVLAGGAVTAIGVIPLLISGVELREYWNGTWQILCYQVGVLSAEERLRLIASTWTDPAMAAYYPFVILYAFQKDRLQKAGIPFWSLLFWLCLDFAGANASNVFKHQIKQLMPPLSLIAGIGIGGFVQAMGGFTSKWLLCLYLCIVAALTPFNSVLIGIAKQWCPNALPGPEEVEERTDRLLAKYIRSHTTPAQCIYVWTINSHPIHLYAERRSSCKYFNALFRFAPDFKKSIAADLAARPPELILVEDCRKGFNDRRAPIPPPPSCLLEFIANGYTPACRIDDFQVYRRSKQNNCQPEEKRPVTF